MPLGRGARKVRGVKEEYVARRLCHAFKDKNRFIVWIPIEAYETKAQVDFFVSHEIAHALHYARTLDFYFQTESEKYSIARQLITEGVATYLAMKITGAYEEDALWADYLPIGERTRWMEECKQKRAELFQFCVKNFNTTNREFFEANKPNDIYRYRAGYYVGLKITEKIFIDTNGMEAMNLLEVPRKEFEQLALQALRTWYS